MKLNIPPVRSEKEQPLKAHLHAGCQGVVGAVEEMVAMATAHTGSALLGFLLRELPAPLAYTEAKPAVC